MITRRRAALAVAGSVLAALVAVPAPAFAAPVAHDDSYALYAGGTYTIDPIANDDTTLLSSGALSLCGISGVDQQKIYAEQSGDSIVVEVGEGFRGRTRITYEACQGSQRDSGTIILDVARLTDLTGAKKKRARGRVVFTDPNAVAVRVSYGSASSGRPDTTRTVPARRSITVSTSRRSIYWLGLFSDRGTIITVGDDVIRGLQTTK
ncbi:hypothetical protein [Nocardioides sp.]|uniref:hypothetical protein n=1 Tax=Nocardioides sp. TaxID=35761 RepID=UPI00271B7D70|nr:hypothetical protein [Nocardioides sp.]MDO9455805.1 hypothetical protein [Nocardioides sp.]